VVFGRTGGAAPLGALGVVFALRTARRRRLSR
jgi:hypothetical protein